MSKRTKMLLYYEEFAAEVANLIMHGISKKGILDRMSNESLYKIGEKLANTTGDLSVIVDTAVNSFKSYNLIRSVIEKSLIIPNNKKHWFIFDEEKGESRAVPADQIRGLFRDSALYVGNARHCKVIYNPHKHVFFFEERSEECFNSYTPPMWKKDLVLNKTPIPYSDIPEIYIEFLKHLTGNHEPSVQYILDWLTNSLRSRNITFLCTIGKGGIGKGVLGQIMKHLHGEENYNEMAFHEATQQFNAALQGKTLVYLDEANQSDGTKQAETVKRLNAENLNLEPKGVDRHSVENFLNVYISSNHLSSLRIAPGDRRFSIVNLGEIKLNEVWAQEKIDSLLHKTNIELLARYLWNRKIQWHSMTTEFADARSREVIEASTSDWEKWILDEFCKDNAGRTLRVTDVIKEAVQRANIKLTLSTNSIRNLANRFPGIFELVKTAEYEYLFPHDDAGKTKNRVYCVSILDKAKQKSYDLIESED